MSIHNQNFTCLLACLLLASAMATSTSAPIKSNSHPVAIIGASYAGLTLANVLHLNSIPYVIYESKTPPFSFITGGTAFNIPSYPSILMKLNLEYTGVDCETRENVICKLWERVKGNIVCGKEIVKMEKCSSTNEFFLHSLTRSDGTRKMSSCGPFQCVVGADGVLSKSRKAALPGIYLIGDARWVNDRWYDLGYRRISEGADLAMVDAVELGEKIAGVELAGAKVLDLDKKKFCASEKWLQKQRRQIIILVVLFAILAGNVTNNRLA